MHAYGYAHINVHTYNHLSTYICTRVYTYKRTCRHLYTYVRKHTCTHVRTYIHICIHVCLRADVYVYVYNTVTLQKLDKALENETIPEPLRQHIEEAWSATVKSIKETKKITSLLATIKDSKAKTHSQKLKASAPKLQDMTCFV